MPYEPALKAANSTPCRWALEILEGLDSLNLTTKRPPSDPGPECVAGLLSQLIARFPQDYARLHDVSGLLFDPDITAYGARTTAVFNRWDTEPGGGPMLPVFLARAAEYFNLPHDGPEMRAAFMAAVLSEIPNDLLYHGNEHYRKVMFHMIRMLATQRQKAFPGQPELEERDLMQMLIAATIHDLGHEGGDNLRDGIYTPGYMEQKAFDIMRPYFDALDIDRDFQGEIETIVFCTDITFMAGHNSPCVRMKKIYRHFFRDDLPADEDVETMILGKLRRFEDNPRLALLAMLLHEADIATSAGLSYEQSRIETINIMRERGLDHAGPGILLRFLTEQLQGRMMTPAAQTLFSAEMNIIMQQAAADLQGGAERF